MMMKIEELITEQLYKKHNEKWWMQQKVKSIKRLQNGRFDIPKGTIFSIERKFNGFSLISEPCPHCGISVRITRVQTWDLALLSN
jgi:hypothetical protein